MDAGLTLRASVLFALGITAALVLWAPPLVALWWYRRTRAPFSAWAYGALVFFVSQCVLRFPWQLPLNAWLAPRIKDHPAETFAWLAASALTAGIFEECGRWAGYRWLLRTERSFRVGVMFGLGHGGIEAMLLVGVGLVWTFVMYILFATGHPPQLPADAHRIVLAGFQHLRVEEVPLAFLERVMAMTCQVAMSLLVMRCFTRQSAWWLLVAIAFHFALDLVGVQGALLLRKYGAYAAELAVVPGFLVSILVIWRASRRQTETG